MAELLQALIEFSAAFALMMAVAAYFNNKNNDQDGGRSIRVPVRVDRRVRRR